MDLTIVIVSFKSGEVLHSCIKSIDKEYPIIVIENSLDNDLKIELERDYNNVKCIIPEKNLGYGAGNNLGIKLARSNYVLILNPDTILFEKTIPNLISQAKLISDFAIIGPKIIEDDKTDIYKHSEKYQSVKYLKGFAILFNKKMFDNEIYFDENFFLYFEEIDLCQRIINSGNKIYIINNAPIKHLGGKSHNEKFSFEMELSRNWHWMWSTFYYYKKNYSYSYALIKIYKNLLTSVLKVFLYSLLLNNNKRKIYYQRMSGILNAIVGKKSWYRPNIK